MADLLDVLEHLVTHAPGLSPDNRAEHLDAVREFARDSLGIEHQAPEPAPEPETALADERDTEIAQLRAELAASRAAQEPAG